MSLVSSFALPFLRSFSKKHHAHSVLLKEKANTLSQGYQQGDLIGQRTSRAFFTALTLFTNKRSDKRITSSCTRGQVFIVGAGPGDAELLTLKALRLLQQADVVLFDALVSKEVLSLIPATVVKEYVGKRCKKHSFTQDAICKRVVELANQGLTVVRLKGGDPALFARTCEETVALSKAHIPFAIVPGITAASGVSAYTGIPLTDRRCAQSVSFMTAHFKHAEQWPEMLSMAQNVLKQTVVVYMGLSRLEGLCSGLMEQGVPSDWPVAAVENATTASQQMVTGTLSDICEHVVRANLSGPTLLIFGKVVESRQQVNTLLLHSSEHAATV